MPRIPATRSIPAPLIRDAFDEFSPIIDAISDRFPAPGHPLAGPLLQLLNLDRQGTDETKALAEDVFQPTAAAGEMNMQHYFGAKAICARLGWKQANRLPELKKRLGIPCFLRADPRCPWRRLYYASESMLAAWELAMAKADRERLLGEQVDNRRKR